MRSEVYRLLLDYKRSPHRWIGLELERFVMNSEGRILTYETDIRQALEELRDQKGWRVDYESEGKVLGLVKNLHAISLEPGSQFEISLAPRKSILEIEQDQIRLDQEILSLKAAKDWHFLGLSVNPWDKVEDRNLLPSPRYGLMNDYFQAHGKRGREMMRLSCGIHVNLDYATEAEGIEMLQVGFFTAPYLAALFANSPYQFGKSTGLLSERLGIWEDTDPARSGILSAALSPTYTLADYAEHVSRVPLMYAFDESDRVFDPKGASLNDLPENIGKRNALPALRQIFTDVRLKPCCVELRTFDQVPAQWRYGVAALCVGLHYVDAIRSQVHSEFATQDVKALRELMHEAARKGLKNDLLYKGLCKLVDHASKALLERGFGEEKYLVSLQKLLSERKTPAEIMIERIGAIPDRQKILKSQI